MNLQTFKAPTMAEALTQVKSSMGTDAVILHTRTFQTRAWLGLRRREMVEITAGRGIGIAERRRQTAARNAPAAPATYARPGAITRRPVESRAMNGRELLETLVTTTGPIVRTKKVGPHIVALIGPTGVGKTTTLAKLAANLKLKDRHRVGLITLDTYRIAAVDQLKRYADIIGSPLRVVSGAEDLADAVQTMGKCDCVLIDTRGRRPNE